MFKKVLIANRSEVALRIISTCRKLGIGTVAVFSDADAESLHVEAADERYRLGGPRLTDSYLNQPALLQAIRDSGADAVHPGYGLLSENAEFAGAVRALGTTFIGPSEGALRTFGDKLQARKLAQSVGVRPPPGTDVAIDAGNMSAVSDAAARIGYPLLVKAAGGGGGIGMARVDASDQLKAAVASCSRRGASAFGDARLYLERFLEQPRHIEVQVVVDTQGHCHVLGERECSVQRRHQKLIEEAPSPASLLTTERKLALFDAASRVIRAAEYSGVATVEFMMDGNGDLHFLEVNPRLQVEHGVTELIYGVDIVELQLRIAAGEDIQLAASPQPNGHAVEVRLYAEDPAKNFLPQPGRLSALEFPPESDTLRIECGFRSGDEITPYYDPLIAKLLSVGPTREQALAALQSALKSSRIDLVGKKGSLQTNLRLLQKILGGQPFTSGQYTTHLVEQVAEP